ncbi:MAG: hypothetical protein LBI61_04245 [Puniceicoccales bacterium]|jgi:flagellar hook-basal body complex protein FliE|nr:hypothetical protein [Puniceicoccales bacterium]
MADVVIGQVGGADAKLLEQIQQITADDGFDFQKIPGLSSQAVNMDAVKTFDGAFDMSGFDAKAVSQNFNQAAANFDTGAPQLSKEVIATIRESSDRIPGITDSLDRQTANSTGTTYENKLSNFFSSVKKNLEDVARVTNRLSKKDALSQQDLMLIQYEVSKMSITLDVASKVGDKGSQALQTLFRDK